MGALKARFLTCSHPTLEFCRLLQEPCTHWVWTGGEVSEASTAPNHTPRPQLVLFNTCELWPS